MNGFGAFFDTLVAPEKKSKAAAGQFSVEQIKSFAKQPAKTDQDLLKMLNTGIEEKEPKLKPSVHTDKSLIKKFGKNMKAVPDGNEVEEVKKAVVVGKGSQKKQKFDIIKEVK